MKLDDFIIKVVGMRYDWKKEKNEAGEDGILLGKPGVETLLHVTYKGIETQDWDDLKKGIPDVSHVTRIVGYYSKVENWNKAKVGELKDRHKGHYGVDEACKSCAT